MGGVRLPIFLVALQNARHLNTLEHCIYALQTTLGENCVNGVKVATIDNLTILYSDVKGVEYKSLLMCGECV